MSRKKKTKEPVKQFPPFEVGAYGGSEITSVSEDRIHFGECSFKLSKDDNGEYISIYEYNRLSAGIEIGKIPPECVETIDEYPTSYKLRYCKQPTKTVLATLEDAQAVHNRICDNFAKVERTLYDICLDLKSMRDDKLYRTLGYETFEQYCAEEFGMSRMHCSRFLSIANNLSEDFVTSRLHFGVKKLYVLSRLTDEQQTELLETTDIENTSVKKLEQKAKEIKGRGATPEEPTEPVPLDTPEQINNPLKVGNYGGVSTAITYIEHVHTKEMKRCFIVSRFCDAMEIFQDSNGEYLVESLNLVTFFSRLGVPADGLKKVLVPLDGEDGLYKWYQQAFDYVATVLVESDDDDDIDYTYVPEENLADIRDFVDFMENADVNELAREHGITLVSHDEPKATETQSEPQEEHEKTKELPSTPQLINDIAVTTIKSNRGEKLPLYDNYYQVTSAKNVQDNLYSYWEYLTKFTDILDIDLNTITDDKKVDDLDNVLSDFLEVQKRFGECLYNLKQYIRQLHNQRRDLPNYVDEENDISFY